MRLFLCVLMLSCIVLTFCSISQFSLKSYLLASHHIPPETVAIVSFFAPDPQAVHHGYSTMANWLGPTAMRSHARYALLQGYLRLTALQCLGNSSGLDHITPKPWAKIFLLSACVERYPIVEYFLWFDADVIITNMRKSVSEILSDANVENDNCSVVVAKDRPLFNTGVILLRSDQKSIDILNALMSLYFIGDYRQIVCCWEQDAMTNLIENSTAHWQAGWYTRLADWLVHAVGILVGTRIGNNKQLADWLLHAVANIEPMQAIVMPFKKGPLCIVRRRALQSFLKLDEYQSGDFAIHATCADEKRNKSELLEILRRESNDTADIPTWL